MTSEVTPEMAAARAAQRERIEAIVGRDRSNDRSARDMTAEELDKLLDDHRGEPILVTLPESWKFENRYGQMVVARPHGCYAWMRDELKHDWRPTADGLDLVFADLADATNFMLRWLG